MKMLSAPPRARARNRRRNQPRSCVPYLLLLPHLLSIFLALPPISASQSPPRRQLQQEVATGAWFCQFPRSTRANDAYTQQNCRLACDGSGVNKNPRCCVEAVVGNVCNDDEFRAAQQEGVQCEPETMTDCTTTTPAAEPIRSEPPSSETAVSGSMTASPTTLFSAHPSRVPTRGPTFTPNVVPAQDKDEEKGEAAANGDKSDKNTHIVVIAGVGGLLLALSCLFICCLSIRRSSRRQQQVRGGGEGGRGGINHLQAPPLAVAALYYDEHDNNNAAGGSLGSHSPIIYESHGALIGQPLEGARSPLPSPSAPPLAPPPVITTLSAVTPLSITLSPPTSPAFDPFGVAAIDYMGLSGEWPSTPTALGTAKAAAAAAAATTRTPNPLSPALGFTQTRESGARVAAAGSRLSSTAPTDGYADLMRLFASSSSSSSSSSSFSSSSSSSPHTLLLHAIDLRLNPLPYRLQAHQAFFRGRFGCTLPPPLPVVAVASSIGHTGSSRTIVVPVTGNNYASEIEEGEEDGEQLQHKSSAGVPVIVQTIYTPFPRSAASALNDELRRWKALPPNPHLLALRGVVCRGDKRRLSVVWDAWPKGRTTLRAWLLSPPSSTSGGRDMPDRPSRRSADTYDKNSNTSSNNGGKKQQEQSLEARSALLGLVGRQLVDALVCLHAQGLGHGDLRLGNIWMDAKTLTLKLGPSSFVRLTERNSLAVTWDDDDDEGRCLEEEEEEIEGYRSPEQQADQSPTAAGNIYALAVLLWTVWTRESLTRPELRSAAVPLPRALEELLIEMWATAPEARPTIAVVQDKLTALQCTM